MLSINSRLPAIRTAIIQHVISADILKFSKFALSSILNTSRAYIAGKLKESTYWQCAGYWALSNASEAACYSVVLVFWLCRSRLHYYFPGLI